MFLNAFTIKNTHSKVKSKLCDICASFQECVSRTLVKKLKKAVEERGYNQVVIAGGVVANSEIRKKVFDLEKEGYHVHAPAMKYCTDNASMVAVF